LKDVEQHLDYDVGSVSVRTDGDIAHLDGQIEGVVKRFEEVALQVQRQQRDLRRAEQLSAVGKLAACVAHEIRNPLQGAKMLLGVALRPQNRKPLTDDDLRVIHVELGRVEQTVQNLLDYARLPVPQRSEIDLREVVTHAADLARARADQQGVAVTVKCPDAEVPARVDRNQLHSVLINLLLNALDAMACGGQLEIELRQVGHQALLRVADTGPGIPPEVMGELFTPFVSSKPTGTGLGLTISRRVVEEHGGSIAGSNRDEGGAIFTIHLPACSTEANHAQAVAHR
jgi:signal transduction histidine kinase